MKKIFLSVLCGFTVNAFAQTMEAEPDTVVLLEETTIEAYRADFTTPVTFKNISARELELLNVGQEPSVLLSFTPSVNSYSDAGNYQGYSYFRLRGIDQTRINITLDGIPLNEPEDQGVYFSNYPDFFNSIESVQIQRGVGTTSNGVASYAGSLNFRSPNLQDERSGKAGVDYGSYNTYRIFTEYNTGVQKDFGLYMRASSLGSDGYKYHSANNSGSVFVSTGLFKPKHQFKFTGFAGTQKNELAWIGVPLDTLRKDARSNGNSIENDKFSQYLVSVKHTWEFSPKFFLLSTAYYNSLNGNYDFDLNNFLSLPLSNEMYNYAFRHNFTGFFSNVNWLHKKMKITSGIHFNMYSRTHKGSERSLGTLYENTGFKNAFSSFVKIKYTIGKMYLFGDVQYRYTNFNYEGSTTFNGLEWSFINPKVGVNYEVGKRTSVYYSFGTCGREPTRNDLFNGEDDLLADSAGNAIFTNVNPEYVQDHELGIRIGKGGWSLASNVYFMSFENEMVLNGAYGPNGLPLHSNVAQSFRSGIEVEAGALIFDRLYASNNSSYSFNRISQEGVEFSPILSPAVLINQAFAYRNDKFNAGVMLKYQGESFIDFDNVISLPAFFTVDVLADYIISNFQIKLHINNITNTEIIANGYIDYNGTPLYFVQARINASGGVVWNF